MIAEKEPQSTNTVLTIRPIRFEFNTQTEASNKFQKSPPATATADAQPIALTEFAGLVSELRSAGVNVIEIEDTPEPHSPDSLFPNNWISTHADGTVVVYPMEAPNRRVERRRDIIERLVDDYEVAALVDLSFAERRSHFLEGTGSLVLDRVNHIAYAALSTRTHESVLDEFARRMDYEVVRFNAVDANRDAIYHTNVMMCLGSDIAVVCMASIPDVRERRAVKSRLQATGHEILEISFDQVLAFAGNMLELQDRNGQRLLAMSRQARRSLTAAQVAVLEKHCTLVSAPIDSIETLAGGSVRCMLAEIHLPPKISEKGGQSPEFR